MGLILLKRLNKVGGAFVFGMALLAINAGCGGSSSSGSTSSVDLFVTDDLTPIYSAVWVTVHKAEIYNASGASTTLFESAEGMPINLRQLNDGASRFLLLAPGKVPDGTYNRVEFRVGKTVNLVAAGTGQASSADFPAAMDADAGRSKLEVPLNPAVTVPGTPRIAIDFDLKQWTVSGGIISSVVGVHPGTGLTDPSRHERFEFKGLVQNLAGTVPTQTFSLQLRFGGTVSVSTSTDTSFVGDGASPFGNGTKAEVYGDFNPQTRTVAARVVRFESEYENEAKAIGRASNIAAVAGTFDLTPKFTRGFVPRGERISVQTNNQTRYRGRRGTVLTQSDFMTALSAAGADAIVEAEGTYTSATNTMTAKSVHIENELELGGVEAKGAIVSTNANENHFVFTISEAEGFTPTDTQTTVRTSATTSYKSASGSVIQKAAFYEAIQTPGTIVKVHGVLREGQVVASRCEIKESGRRPVN